MMLYHLAVQDHLADDWCLMAVWDECKRRNRLGDDEVSLLSFRDGTDLVAYSHCIRRIDGAGVE